MALALFRDKAIQSKSDQCFGDPIALMPRSWEGMILFFGIFALSVMGFLATANFPRKEAASGILRLSHGEVRVSAPKAGFVTEIHVREGQIVAAGDLLAFITTEQRLALGEVYDARILDAVERERTMLEQHLAALNTSEPLQAGSLRERIDGITRQLREYDADRIGRAKRLKLAHDSVQDYATLVAKGIYGAEFLRQRQQTMLEQEQSVTDLDAQILSLKSQKLDLALQLSRLPSDVAQTRASILQQLAALEEKRADATAQNGFALIARAGGVITSLQAQIGDPVDANHPLMTIIPAGSVLQAELYVPSRAAGFIAAGDRVRLMYDAFPYTRFGPGFATIATISTAVLRPEEVAAAVKAQEPVYRVVATLESTAMHAYGRDMPLQSGMALQADILLEDRTFLDLLLDPLRAATGRTLGS
jgi:membrane fusion protein